jgi:hypothetical protein
MTAHGLNGGCRGPNITNERLRAVPPVNLTGVEGPAANDTPRRQGRGSELVLQLKKKALQRRPSRRRRQKWGDDLGLWII